MDILVIFTIAKSGGGVISTINTLKGLKNKGQEIFAIVPAEGYVTEMLRNLNINYIIIPFFFSVYPKTHSLNDYLLFTPRLIRMLYKRKIAINKIFEICKKNPPKIIYTISSVVDIGFQVSKKLNIPHLWHIREYGDKDFGYIYYPNNRSLKRKISQESYAIAITNDLKHHFNLSTKGKVIYNGINDGIPKSIINKKENFFLFLGAITENKGVSELIQAFIRYKELGGNNKLILLGNGDKSYINKLKKELKEYQIEDLVTFMGFLKNVSPYLQNAYSLIVPSVYEGFGRITAEAMTCGCPVIGKNTGGTKEQFDLGYKLFGEEIGFRYDTMEDLVSQMLFIENITEEKIQEMTNKAQNFVCTQYNYKKNIEETYSFINDIIKS